MPGPSLTFVVVVAFSVFVVILTGLYLLLKHVRERTRLSRLRLKGWLKYRN